MESFYRTVAMLILFPILIGVVFPVFCEKTAVLILARGGSKGIRMKNLRNVGGISLLGRTILTARSAGFLDITVSTDHPLIALEALRYNVTVFKRSFVTATDWAPSIWGVTEFIRSRPEIDIIILLQTTSPLVNSKHLRFTFTKLNFPVPYDCIFSVTRSYKLRWSYKNSGIHPLNFDYKNRPRRQDWNGEFIETGAFYMSRREIVMKGYLQNNNCTVWEISQEESLEVDTEHDLRLANILITNN